MRQYKLLELMLAVAVVAFTGSYAKAAEFLARLSGFNEIGGLGAGETGAILSEGKGTLHLELDKSAGMIAYTLTYSGLTAVQQAHIHFGKVHVAGGIMAFLCTNLGMARPGPRPARRVAER